MAMPTGTDTIVQHVKEGLPIGPGRRLYFVVIVIALAIIVLRRPDAILIPQFWAEDGMVFYADAYNEGMIMPLLSPHGGYLDTFPRLVAAFSQLFPLSWAPLLFNLAALLLRVLPVGLILSSRFCELIPDWKTRLFLSFLYLNLPNSWEINAGIISGKTHLSVLAFMILSVSPSSHLLWLFFDTGIVLLSGLSGPFCIILTPLSALFLLDRRDMRSLALFVLIGICAVIQGIFLMTGDARPQRALGATPELFVKILTTQVFLGALVGQKGLELLRHARLHNVVVIIVALLGHLALINALVKAPLPLRLFVLYGLFIFCAALLSPLVNLTDPQWPLLLLPGVGGRYWFIPMLAFISVLVWSLRGEGSFISRRLAAFALAVMVLGIVLDWRYPAFKDLNFREHASRFESSHRGTQASIPLNPSGWSIILIKH